jgi:hypothetical protein
MSSSSSSGKEGPKAGSDAVRVRPPVGHGERYALGLAERRFSAHALRRQAQWLGGEQPQASLKSQFEYSASRCCFGPTQSGPGVRCAPRLHHWHNASQDRLLLLRQTAGPELERQIASHQDLGRHRLESPGRRGSVQLGVVVA